MRDEKVKRFFKTILVLALLFVGLEFAYQKAAPEIEKTFGTRNPLPYLTAKVQQFISPEKIQNDDKNADSSKPLKRQVKAVEKIADSAKTQADIAVKTSKKADIKGWISVIIALLAFLLELSGRLGLF